MFDTTQFTHDVAGIVFHDTDGVQVTDDAVEFDWSEIEKVRVDDVPWADAFETNVFYKIPATVARPIKQQYYMGKDAVTLMKPREELKKAAWSLHNAPWTLAHPSTGMVKNVDDVHGFWRNPRYVDSMDNLDADLYVPTNDAEARQYLEQHSDVSVGFYNQLTRVAEYDGVVGNADSSDNVDGYQTNMYFDHVASVPRGRCSGEKGCGLQDEYINEARITVLNEDAEHNGKWYAVRPSENPDGEWKYPINNCSDVQDAWKLRNHGHLSISVSTLEERIKRRARALDCPVPGTTNDTMEENNDCGGSQFDAASFSFEYLYSENDAVKAEVDAKDEKIDSLESDLSDAQDSLAVKEEKLTELQERVDAYEAEEKKELVAQILEKTQALGDEETLMDLDLDDLQDKFALVDELSVSQKDVKPEVDEENEKPTYDMPLRASPWDVKEE